MPLTNGNVPGPQVLTNAPHSGDAAYGDPGYHYGGTGSEDLYNQESQQWNQYAGEGVQPTGVDPSLIAAQQNSYANNQQSQGQQQAAFGLMSAQANGGDTPAQQQARAAMAYANSGQHAMNANAGGAQALAAARNSANQNAATQGSMQGNNMNALKAQEMATGRSLMGDMGNSMRNSEQKLYGINSDQAYGLAQNQANINAANDALMLGYSDINNQSLAGQRQVALGQGEFNLQQNAVNAQQGATLMGGIAGGIGGAAKGFGSMGGSGGGADNGGGASDYSGGEGQFWNDVQSSDERMKANVHRTSLMRPFLDTLADSRATYQYKDYRDEPRAIPTGGRYAGVMAQDLEDVPEIGHQLVIDTPHGKMVDTKTALSALLAGVGDIHERVRRLEGGRSFADE